MVVIGSSRVTRTDRSSVDRVIGIEPSSRFLVERAHGDESVGSGRSGLPRRLRCLPSPAWPSASNSASSSRERSRDGALRDLGTVGVSGLGHKWQMGQRSPRALALGRGLGRNLCLGR